MKRNKKAVGYVCAVPIPGTKGWVSKEEQKARLLSYAAKENVTLVCVYEDEAYTPEVLSRPGVKEMLACSEPFEAVLCERIWAFGRKNKDVEPLLAELDKREVKLAASTYLWDMVSQQVRHRYNEKLAARAQKEASARAAAKLMKEVA